MDVTNFQLYSNIFTNIAALQNTGCYNKFDSTKSSGVYYWYAKIPQCGYKEHGLKDIVLYVKNI